MFTGFTTLSKLSDKMTISLNLIAIFHLKLWVHEFLPLWVESISYYLVLISMFRDEETIVHHVECV